MPPSPASTVVRGRPGALEDLARVADDVGGDWRARSVALLDAMEAAAVADLGGMRIDTAPAQRLRSVGTQLTAAGSAIGAFSLALRSVDHLVDRHGVATASYIAVARRLLAHRHDATDTAIAEILSRLPDGRRRSLEDFEQMSASERMQWMDAFVDTSGDERHRAITGVLAYLADSATIRGDDPSVFGDTWWSVADAAVLVVIQDGWLRHQGVATPADRPRGVADARAAAYDDAVAAWASHVEALERGDLSEDDALRSWIRAEQAGVVFAEIEVAHVWSGDPTFVPPTLEEWEAITALAPGTHTFRLSILAGTERDFVLSIVDAVIEHGVDAFVPDGETGNVLVPGLGPVPPDLVEAAGRHIGDAAGGWTDGWGLGAITNIAGGAIGIAGSLHRISLDRSSAAAEFVATETIQAIVSDIEGFTPDAVEREIALALVDPTVVPSEPLRRGFDLLFGTDRADDGLSFTYYFPMLIESGWLPALPGYWVDENGTRHRAPPPVRAGRLRAD